MSANLARGKPTKQSTTYQTYSSSKAVDGKMAYNLRDNSCSHAARAQKGSWWQVDLEAVYEIRCVIIKNRADCCGQFIYRYRYIYIYI